VVAARVPFGDGRSLRAEAEVVEGRTGVVVCHPHPAFGGRLDTPLVVALADGFRAAGLGAVRFNFRGLDGSDGQPTGGLREHEDVAAVAAWLRRAGASSVAVVGYSFGALMAAKAVAGGLPVDGWVAIGLPTTIVGEDAERVRSITGAIASAPSLFLSGDRDRFCEVDRIAGWVAGRVDAGMHVHPGEGHFFGGATSEVVRRAVAFIVDRLDP
jgi:alpha/beta superfamily hydrolase